ncbi:MAG: zinc ABC transporter substrate-binding protein [Deinococcus sp.]|nr:zinc ABC transporter substrate-binding protein [Deinococcus sp.]
MSSGQLLRMIIIGTLLAVLGSAPVFSSQASPLVVATFFPVFDFARRIGEGRAQVQILVRAGLEPHDFEPTVQDVETIAAAALFIYHGSGIENPWVDPLLQAGTLDPARQVIVETTRGLRKDGLLLAAPEPDAAVLRSDPHLWLDPVLAQELVNATENGFIALDPAGRESYEDHARALRRELAQLDSEIRQALASCQRQELVISHRFLDYFAERYGLTVVAAAGLEPAEPTIEQLESVIAFARQRRLRFVFAETLLEAELTGVQTVADVVGAQVLTLSSLEGLRPEEQARGADYFAVMRQNLQHLRIGLECS